MATRHHDFVRFCCQYKKVFVILGCLLAVQILLAIKVMVLHADSSQSNDIRIVDRDRERKSSSSSLQQLSNVKSNKQSPIGSPSSLLDPGALTFTPECEITLKESVSAIQRAKTGTCKEELAKTACKITNDTLYPKRLPRFCLNNETTYGKHLGCFRDEQKNRIFPDAFTLLKKDNSPSNCIDLCLQSGFQYAGVQYSIECFCGNSRPSKALVLKSAECNMKCPSLHFVVPQSDNISNGNPDSEGPSDSGASVPHHVNPQEICGGFFAMNIYETGVFQDFELKNEIVTLEDGNKHHVTKPVRIVFLLTLNGRAYRQVIRLIKSLFHERHFFYVHVDARQDYLYRELLMLAQKLPNNFRFMTNRRATIWGGASLLTVLLSAMQDLVTNAKEWNWDWDYVINLSESDFPLKSTGQLEKFLGLNNGRNFIKSHGRDVQKFIQKQGLDKTFYECEYRMWRMGDRKLPKGIIMDGGSDWVALHRKFVEYVVQTDDDLVEGLKTVFKHTLLPAESFFHTTLRNSHLCHTFVDNNLHVTNWKRKLGCKCQYRNVVDWCGCSPNDFRLSDWQRLQLTENRLLFFGRKFESVVSQGIVNKLESWLYPSRFLSHAPTSDRFWQSIYHHYDLSPKADDAVITLANSLSRLATKIYLSKSSHSKNSSSLLSFFGKSNRNIKSKSSLEELAEAEVEAEAEQEQNYGSFSSLKVFEMNVYLQDDRVQGILVRFHQEIGKFHIALEAWFKLRNWFKIESQSHVKADPEAESDPNSNSRNVDDGIGNNNSNIKEVQVGIDYDQKEQIFRHFSRAIGPTSEPTLAYNCVSLEAFNATFVWINPAQSIEATMNVSINEGSTANFVKPSLKTPLLPGNWTVQIWIPGREKLYSRVEFLVMPLQFYGGLPISSAQARIIHSQPPEGDHCPGADAEEQKQCGQELIEWIDMLVAPHYEFQDICLEKQLNEMKNNEEDRNGKGMDIDIDLCSQTEWSSLYPDPKSTVEGIDRLTGLLVP